MKRHTYRCPFGATTLLADNERSLKAKIVTHNTIAHGVRPIIVCGAAPMRWDANSATLPDRHSVESRPFALSLRGI